MQTHAWPPVDVDPCGQAEQEVAEFSVLEYVSLSQATQIAPAPVPPRFFPA